MCRSKIDTFVSLENLKNSNTGLQQKPIGSDVYAEFMSGRDEYIKKLRGRCAKNAGFVGKGRLSRDVASCMSDALEEAEMLTASTQRIMVGKKAEVTINNDIIHVSYKPKGKRKPITEEYDYMGKDELVEELTGSDLWSVMDLCMYYPQFYWLIYYHYEKNVKEGMKQLNILEKEHKRRRTRR
jgi:hypothetical protein